MIFGMALVFPRESGTFKLLDQLLHNINSNLRKQLSFFARVIFLLNTRIRQSARISMKRMDYVFHRLVNKKICLSPRVGFYCSVDPFKIVCLK